MHTTDSRKAVIAIIVFSFIFIGGSMTYAYLDPSPHPMAPHKLSTLNMLTHTSVERKAF